MTDGRARVTHRDAARQLRSGARSDCAARTRRATRSWPCVCSRRPRAAACAVPREAIEQGLADAEWPARLELIPLDERPPGAARRRAQRGRRPRAGRLPRAMASGTSAARHRRRCATRTSTSIAGDAACRMCRTVIATAAPTPRAIPADDLARHLRGRRRRATSRVEPDAGAGDRSGARAGADGLRRRVDLPRRRGSRRPQAACYPAVIPCCCASSSPAALVAACVCLAAAAPVAAQQADHRRPGSSPPATGSRLLDQTQSAHR